MGEQMEEVCVKECVFEDSLQIDFDYEFDVAKFFDFLRPETVDEIVESQRWFHFSQGHPPSPLLLELGLVTEDQLEGGDSTDHRDNRGESRVSSGHELLKSKSANQSRLSKNSRLLQPTASQLAKQNQHIVVRGTRTPARFQKLGSSSLKSSRDIDATKRQKLEYGYLRKVGQLKHQTSFSYKLPRQVGSSNGNSCHARPKATVPKEHSVETANRAQQHRSKSVAERSKDSKKESCFVRALSLNRNPLEVKKSTPSLSPEIKVPKKNIQSYMKENKNPNTVVQSTRCCLKQTHIARVRMTVMAC